MPCRDHFLLTKRSAPPPPQVLPHLPLSNPCPASLLSLPWPHNTSWSKNRSSSHQKHATLLTWKEPPKFFCAWRAPSPPQAPHQFPPGRAGSAGAKAAKRTSNSGFLQNFPAGNKPRQSIALQRGDSPDELIPGAVRILGPDPRCCAGYSYSSGLGLATALAGQGTGSSGAISLPCHGREPQPWLLGHGEKGNPCSQLPPARVACMKLQHRTRLRGGMEKSVFSPHSQPAPRGLPSGVREQPSLHLGAGSRAALQACVVQSRARRLGFTRRGANPFPGK